MPGVSQVARRCAPQHHGCEYSAQAAVDGVEFGNRGIAVGAPAEVLVDKL